MRLKKKQLKLVVKVCVLTDAVVSQEAGQALPLVLGVVVPLPLLELLTGQILVLRLPLRERVNK